MHLDEHSTGTGRPAGGFTLVELMISIALVLLLVLGINAVFKASSDTTSTGVALSEVVRNQRSAQRMLSRDFQKAVVGREMPCLLIFSEAQAAFRDFAEMNSDLDYRPGDPPDKRAKAIRTIDIDGNGREGDAFGEIIGPATYGNRNHRLDRIAFFARDGRSPFPRHTGNQSGAAELVTADASREAWIWYGHLRLGSPDNNGDYPDPGAGTFTTNPKNFFSSDWAFGRVAMLLKLEQNALYDRITPQGSPLGPLGIWSTANVGPWRIQHSRFDVAATSIQAYRAGMAGVTNPASPGAMPLWWQHFDYRFNGKPNPARGSQDLAAEMALAVPVLLRGVSQFMVEYAGDYLEQVADGTVISVSPDGEIDFIVLPDLSRRIRWYGMPRNVETRDDPASGPMIRGKLQGRASINDMMDVVPLQDVIDALGAQATVPFERFYSTPPGNPNNIRPIRSVINYAHPSAGMPEGARYVCAWSPWDFAAGWGPKMIRVVMTFSDGNNRLPDGQTVEYVFKLP